MSEKKESPIGDMIKKVVSVGVGAAFMTEESVKKILEDLPLPKDIISGLVHNAKGAKEDFTNGIREEIKGYLSKVDATKLVSDLLDKYDVEVEAKFKSAHLIAVTKYSPVEDVVSAYEAQHFDFGENRVPDLQAKANFFEKEKLTKVRWHFIGHLQTNKVRDLYKIPNLYAIHSVDSLSLLEELIKRESDFKGTQLRLFFQVNTSHEIEKNGFETAEELKLAVDLLLGRVHSKLKFEGLMTMGTIRTTEFEAEASRCFNDLKDIARRLEETYHLKEKLKLSMGMSQDYKLALLAGSDFIRVGSAIFKPHTI